MRIVKLLFALSAILSAFLVLWKGLDGLIAVVVAWVGCTVTVALVVWAAMAARGDL